MSEPYSVEELRKMELGELRGLYSALGDTSRKLTNPSEQARIQTTMKLIQQVIEEKKQAELPKTISMFQPAPKVAPEPAWRPFQPSAPAPTPAPEQGGVTPPVAPVGGQFTTWRVPETPAPTSWDEALSVGRSIDQNYQDWYVGALEAKRNAPPEVQDDLQLIMDQADAMHNAASKSYWAVASASIKSAVGGAAGDTALDYAKFELQKQMMAFEQQKFEKGNEQWEQAQAQARELALLREENDIRKQIMANQMTGAATMGQAWASAQNTALQGMSTALPPGVDYIPGYEPGGVGSRLGLPVRGREFTTPFDPYLGVQRTQEAVNQALSNPLMGGR